jgi:hypothetical protein
VDKTYTWNFHEVTWPDLYYLEEPIVTGSTIEFKIETAMPADSSAYEDYCAGFDSVITVKINGNVKTFSAIVGDDYSTYLAYLLIPLEASYPLYSVYLSPMEYLPLVIPVSSGGEIAEEDVIVTEDDAFVYIYAEETDVTHDARVEASTGHCPLWQAWDPMDSNNYITLTMDGYSGEIPPIGGDPYLDDDIPDEFDWDDFDFEDNWSEDWDWEDLNVDWDEYDYDVDDMDMDIWFNGSDDLDFEDVDWEDLEADFEELEDWDWGEEGLEDLGCYFELTTDGDINHIHIEIDITLEEGVDATTVKLYYYDESKDEWVKIETSVYNEDTGKIEADVDHLTVFAAMAEDTAEPADDDDSPSGFVVAVAIMCLVGAVFLFRRKR